MSDVPQPADAGVQPDTEAPKPDVEREAFLERLNKESAKRKEEAAKTASLEKELASLRAQMEERETAGLPELERERKRAEQLEKRAEEADKRAAEAEQRVQRNQRERWVTAAAQAANFADPSDASAFLDLGEIEDEKDAERAVKRLATKKQHLLRSEDPKLPGRVLADGRPANGATTATDGIDPNGEAAMLADGLKQFLKNR